MSFFSGLENELALALHAVAGLVEKQPALTAEVLRFAAHALSAYAPAAAKVIGDVEMVAEAAVAPSAYEPAAAKIVGDVETVVGHAVAP